MEDAKLMEFGFINALLLFLFIPLLIFIYHRYNSSKKESVLKFSSLKIIKKTDATKKSTFSVYFECITPFSVLLKDQVKDMQNSDRQHIVHYKIDSYTQ